MLDSLERYLARGQWHQAGKEAKALLLLPPGTLTDEQMGKLYWGYGRACAWLQDYYGAVRLFELAIQHAFQVRDWDTLGFARAQTGNVSVFIGDVAAANEMFAVYYLDLPRYKEARACEPLVRYNNGLALRRQQRHGEAVVAYRMALDLYMERGKTTEAGECHQNLAWLHLLDNKPDVALPHLECAQSYVDALTPQYRAEMLVCWGLYHFVRREVGSAMEYLAEVLNVTSAGTALNGITDHHRSEASWLSGEIALLLKRFDKALRLAKAAQHHAILAREPELMNRACGLLARIKEAGEEGADGAAE